MGFKRDLDVIMSFLPQGRPRSSSHGGGQAKRPGRGCPLYYPQTLLPLATLNLCHEYLSIYHYTAIIITFATTHPTSTSSSNFSPRFPVGGGHPVSTTDKPRQTLLFSATFSREVREIAASFLRQGYQIVDTVGEEVEQTHEHVTQVS